MENVVSSWAIPFVSREAERTRRGGCVSQERIPPSLGNFCHREILSRTRGRLDVAVPQHVIAVDSISRSQGRNEAAHGGKLRRRGRTFFEIANERDSDAAPVVRILSRVSAVKLLPPAKRRLDLSVPHSAPVANHKVISDPDPGISLAILALQMGGVD